MLLADEVKKDEMGETCSSSEKWRIYKIVVRKPEGGNNLVDRYRLQVNFKIDFRVI